MKIIGNRLCPAHGNAGGKVRVRAKHPTAFAALRVRIEMHNLTSRMHPRIGATGAGDRYGFIGDFRQTRFDRRLHTRRVSEPLPAVEIRPVVFNAQCNAHNVVPLKNKKAR